MLGVSVSESNWLSDSSDLVELLVGGLSLDLLPKCRVECYGEGRDCEAALAILYW